MFFHVDGLLSLLVSTIWARATVQVVQPSGAIYPVAVTCSSDDSIVCIDRFASVLSYPFNLPAANSDNVTDFRHTSVASDASFNLVKDASFVVFDRERGLRYLGDSPSHDLIFDLGDVVHGAPVYMPDQNLLYLSQLEEDYQLQLVIDLNQNPPTLSDYLPSPPVQIAKAGAVRDGKIIVAASRGTSDGEGFGTPVSLCTIDPTTNKSTVLLNNYFGTYFNNIEDLAVHPVTGDIFFTSPAESRSSGRADAPVRLPSASWRFNLDTGATYLVDSTLQHPGGIAFTSDGTTLYIADSDLLSSTEVTKQATSENTHVRTIYAFDVSHNGSRVSNKRAFYMASSSIIPNGLKVSREGLVLVATGKGIDVLDEMGQMVMRVQMNYTVENFAWTGEDLRELWIVGHEGVVSRVRWDIQGSKII